MPTELKDVLKTAREKKGWSLREAEKETGIHNAHLSQLETGTITRPSEALLWRLSSAYVVDYMRLLRLAGHTTKQKANSARRSLAGAALHALEDLSTAEQKQVIEYMEELRRRRDSEDEAR